MQCAGLVVQAYPCLNSSIYCISFLTHILLFINFSMCIMSSIVQEYNTFLTKINK